MPVCPDMAFKGRPDGQQPACLLLLCMINRLQDSLAARAVLTEQAQLWDPSPTLWPRQITRMSRPQPPYVSLQTRHCSGKAMLGRCQSYSHSRSALPALQIYIKRSEDLSFLIKKESCLGDGLNVPTVMSRRAIQGPTLPSHACGWDWPQHLLHEKRKPANQSLLWSRMKTVLLLKVDSCKASTIFGVQETLSAIFSSYIQNIGCWGAGLVTLQSWTHYIDYSIPDFTPFHLSCAFKRSRKKTRHLCNVPFFIGLI